MKMNYKIYALGPAGSNGHQVATIAQKLDFKSRNVEIIFLPSHEQIFKMVIEGDDLCYGLVPIENSTSGLVSDVIDFWLNDERAKYLTIFQEYELPIDHNLLARTGVSIDDCKYALSHTQALSQCRKTLLKLNLKTKIMPSTSYAARFVSKSKSKLTAVGSKFLAKQYDLNILIPNISDYPSNSTRFNLISKKHNFKKGKGKTSIIFRLKNNSGSLAEVLLPLKKYKINMTSIHSLSLGKMGEFAFYCEIDININDKFYPVALKEMKSKCLELRVVGSFSCIH